MHNGVSTVELIRRGNEIIPDVLFQLRRTSTESLVVRKMVHETSDTARFVQMFKRFRFMASSSKSTEEVNGNSMAEGDHSDTDEEDDHNDTDSLDLAIH